MSVSAYSSSSTQASVPYGLVVGLVAQLGLLAVLAASVGLGAAGWLVGTAYALVVCATLGLALRRAGARHLGPANQVTLARATLVGGVTALVVESLNRPVPLGVLVPLATVALLLDAVDGQVARRTRTTSAVGARFDMEIDALLLLALSVFVARDLGGWVLAISLLRYAFVVAGAVLPWLTAPLPPAMWRKTVAAAQGIVLVAASSGLAPRPVEFTVVGLALAVLVVSFGRDIRWLWRRRGARSAVATAHRAPVPAQQPPVPVQQQPVPGRRVGAGPAPRVPGLRMSPAASPPASPALSPGQLVRGG